MMNIEIIESVYQTNAGIPVTILATGLDGASCKIAGIVHCPNGSNLLNWWPSFDYLVKIPQLTDLKIDDKVMVRNYDNKEWLKRYFAGISDNGKIFVFCDGVTSWTNNGSTIEWNQWRLPAEDEL